MTLKRHIIAQGMLKTSLSSTPLQRGYEREQETGKQCKAVPTLRKQADSVHTEPACFMLVGALPQSPQNTSFVFWNDG